MLYYDLFYIQRFCYLSWIYGMWNKCEMWNILNYHYLIHIQCVTLVPHNHQWIVYYTMAYAAVVPHRAQNHCCYLPSLRSLLLCNHFWFDKAALLGNHGLCIALFSFTLLTWWLCPLDKGLWWAVNECQFCKQVFLKVKFSTLTHEVDVQT